VKRLYVPAVRGSTEPWWTTEAPLDPPTRPLEDELSADVAIVGGGYTGLWTALALREHGADVVLVEALRCGDGASARNGGFLHGYWSSLPRLERMFGPDAALELASASTGVYNAVLALGGDVWLNGSGLVLVSASPAHDARLDDALAVARRLGATDQVTEVDPPFASPRARRAIRYRDGATVQPARMLRALRRACIDAGVRLYERSPAVEIVDGRVVTPSGIVRAAEIVIATNAWSPAKSRYAVFRSAIVLSDPIPDLQWREGESVFDARSYLHYFRPTRDNRILMGSASGEVADAERALRAFFPQHADVPIAARWEGPIDVSSDRLPFFGTIPGTRIHYGAGYTGNGVGPCWLGGRLLAELATGGSPSSPLVTRKPVKLPPEPIRSLGAAVVRRAILALDDAESYGRTPNAVARAVASVPRLLGITVASR
jgi:glycine/D-amino acid oxidase-like deaminating enzyme